MIGVVTFDLMSGSKDITTLSAIAFGLLGGLVVSYLFWAALNPIVMQYLTSLGVHGPRLASTLQVMITVVICYLAVSMLLQTKDEFRFIIPYVEFSKQVKGASRWFWIPVSLLTAELPIFVIRGSSTPS